MNQNKPKTIVVNVGYDIQVRIPDPGPVIEQEIGSHGIQDCGHHYNIFEEDDGFPQDRFFKISNKEGG